MLAWTGAALLSEQGDNASPIIFQNVVSRAIANRKRHTATCAAARQHRKAARDALASRTGANILTSSAWVRDFEYDVERAGVKLHHYLPSFSLIHLPTFMAYTCLRDFGSKFSQVPLGPPPPPLLLSNQKK